tara:strand:- start:4301 stop:5566 length:1266 start_codon:yes stop_codon:yes gene_type:complete
LSTSFAYFKNEKEEKFFFSSNENEFLDNLLSNYGNFSAIGFFSGEVKIGRIQYLWRDPIGSAKLYFYINKNGELISSKSWIELIKYGAEITSIYSLPKGTFVKYESNTFELISKISIPYYKYTNNLAEDLKERLDKFFEQFKKHLQKRKNNSIDPKIYLALSGGLDSSYLLLRSIDHNIDITNITVDLPYSKDSIIARSISKKLNQKHITVNSDESKISEALNKAPLICDDWRDFNVHCAVINMLIGEKIKSEENSEKFIITGDYMNEYLCDYQEETFKGNSFYKLPNISRKKLQQHLISGLETSSREDCVFRNYGLNLIQPYSVVLDIYLSLGKKVLSQSDVKKKINLIESEKWLINNISKDKIRAQIGNKETMGILGIASDYGFSDQTFIDIISKEVKIDQNDIKDLFFAGRFRTIKIK